MVNRIVKLNGKTYRVLNVEKRYGVPDVEYKLPKDKAKKYGMRYIPLKTLSVRKRLGTKINKI